MHVGQAKPILVSSFGVHTGIGAISEWKVGTGTQSTLPVLLTIVLADFKDGLANDEVESLMLRYL